MSGQIADRILKLEKIRALGVDPYGGRLTGISSVADVRAAAERLAIQPGQVLDTSDAVRRAAGRVHLLRDTGKLIFLTVRDWSGELQWALSKKMVEEAAHTPTRAASHRSDAGAASTTPADTMDGSGPRHASPTCGVPPERARGEAPFPDGPTAWQLAKLLDLGDIVGAEGRLGRTKTGELTLWVTRFMLLSKALRPPPEKWHGLADVEARYRRRYVDLLANPDSQRVFVMRARVIEYIRRVLHARNFIEVETPALQPIYGGAAARPFVTHHNALDMRLYLRISPELYLKRCLVGGLERVYEFSRCFRNEGISRRHNPEFTMLELYQAYGDYHDMMDITEAIVAGAARELLGTYQIGLQEQGGDEQAAAAPIDLTPPWPRRRYADLLREHAGVDLRDRAAVRRRAEEAGILARLARARRAAAQGVDPARLDAPGMEQLPSASAAGVEVDHALLVNALFEEFAESHLIQPAFVIDYPAPLCPLTKRHPDDAQLALRFEAYVRGTEIGNAYSELNDPAVQRENMMQAVAGEGDETMRVMDEDFCEALEYGMPPAGGLGIGIDRLCMLLLGCPSIRDVLLFPLQRPQGG
jgi:lysyl-tRNA synthetase class 2